MPPTPCPERLGKLIARVNRQSSDESHVLRQILTAIQNKRQNNKGPDTYVVNLPSTITINLTNYESHIRNELADALADIDPPDLIERIRECPVEHCNSLFWAGRDDKVACDTHVARWRQKEYRRNKKIRDATTATKRRKAQAINTFDGMSRTAQAVIRAIIGAERPRSFGRIDSESADDLRDTDDVIPSTWVVRNVTHSLYKDGYLDFYESADRRDRRGFSPNDRYYPTQKLIDLWNDKTARIPKQS
jgi:hypothetical protein